MKDTELFDAIAHIDEDLVDRCLAEDETVREKTSEPASGLAATEVKPLSARKIITSVLAAAAALLLFFGLLTVLHIGGKSPIDPANSRTDEPTAEPTEGPTEKPFTYDEHDCAALRSFFEAADENGVRNGEKLFAQYDPDDPGSWFTSFDGDEERYWGNESGKLYWSSETGRLTRLELVYGNETSERAALSGRLELTGMPELEKVYLGKLVLDDIVISAVPQLSSLQFNQTTTRSETVVSLDILDELYIESAQHCRLVYSGGPISGKPFDFTIDLSTAGGGTVGIYSLGGALENEQNYAEGSSDKVVVMCGAYEGMYFDNLYDANGAPADAEATPHYCLNPGDGEGLEGEFIYKAVFLPAAPGNTENVRIIPKESALFTEEEIAEAIEVVLADFRKDWWGCTLTEIGYAGDDAVRSYQPYSPWTNGERMMMLISSFEVAERGADQSFEPGTWSDWNWILVQQEDGSWVHVDHGY